MKARTVGVGQVGPLHLQPCGVSCEDSFTLILPLDQGTPTPLSSLTWCGEAKLSGWTLAGMLCRGGQGEGREKKSCNLTSFALLRYAFFFFFFKLLLVNLRWFSDALTLTQPASADFSLGHVYEKYPTIQI